MPNPCWRVYMLWPVPRHQLSFWFLQDRKHNSFSALDYHTAGVSHDSNCCMGHVRSWPQQQTGHTRYGNRHSALGRNGHNGIIALLNDGMLNVKVRNTVSKPWRFLVIQDMNSFHSIFSQYVWSRLLVRQTQGVHHRFIPTCVGQMYLQGLPDKETKIRLPEQARIFDSYVCDCCGETTGANWIRLSGDKKLCLDCYETYDRFDV